MTDQIVLPEIVVPGRRLGRHINHQPASLNYLLAESTPKSASWVRHTPILDQGEVGACTGNAMTGALGTGPLWDAVILGANGATFDEAMALQIYSAAETLDGDGPYPPNDHGSSGLSVAKVAKTEGYISGYLHATSLAAAYTAIAAGPFIMGSYWWTSMDQPDAAGLVTVGGSVRGGHEYMCRAYDAATDLFTMDNSWGQAFGVAGSFTMSSATLSALLAKQGDITSLVPMSEPAPTPTPAPVGSALATFRAVADPWVTARHETVGNQAMAAATKSYLASL